MADPGRKGGTGADAPQCAGSTRFVCSGATWPDPEPASQSQNAVCRFGEKTMQYMVYAGTFAVALVAILSFLGFR